MFCVNQWNSGITGVCRKISGEGDAPTLLPPAHATVVRVVALSWAQMRCCMVSLAVSRPLLARPVISHTPLPARWYCLIAHHIALTIGSHWMT